MQRDRVPRKTILPFVEQQRHILMQRPLKLNGNAAVFPAPSCAPAPVADPVSAAPSSDDGPAPQLLPPTDLPASASASASVPVPVPVVAPSESLRAASLAQESSRDDPFAELSPGPLSAAPQVCRSRRSPLRRRSRHSACPLTAGRPAYQPGQRRTQPAILSTAATSPRHMAPRGPSGFRVGASVLTAIPLRRGGTCRCRRARAGAPLDLHQLPMTPCATAARVTLCEA